MTRNERELIICRYLGGDMTSAEEHDFFIQVAIDKELRHELKAHRTVDSAMRKDRDAEAAGHTALRMRVAAMLPSAIADPSLPRTGAHAPAPTGVGLSPALTAAGAVSVSMKWIVAAIGGALLTAGALLTVQLASPSVSSDQRARAADSASVVRPLEESGVRQADAVRPGTATAVPGTAIDSSSSGMSGAAASKASAPEGTLEAQTTRRARTPGTSAIHQGSERLEANRSRRVAVTPGTSGSDSNARSKSDSGDSIPVSVKIRFGDK